MVVNRSGLYTKIHKVLKKHYKPATPNTRLPLMQQLLYGCCLENAAVAAADKALAALESDYYDWNEVRVSTATELSESMNMLPDPLEAGNRTKQILQSVFETNYSFDIEQLKKENIGAAVKKLQKLKGVTPFSVAYATQMTLAGHSIPVGSGALEALYIVGVISEKEKEKYQIPGIERAIPKNRGVEFGLLLNQLGAELIRAPHGAVIKKILIEISPDAKERLPKRKSSKAEEPKKGTAAQKKGATKSSKAVAKEKTTSKQVGKKAKAPIAKKATKAKKKITKVSVKKKPAKKKATSRSSNVKKISKKKITKKKITKKKAASKKTVKKKAVKAAKKVAGKAAKKKTSAKSATSRIARRKPR